MPTPEPARVLDLICTSCLSEIAAPAGARCYICGNEAVPAATPRGAELRQRAADAMRRPAARPRS